MLTLRPATVIYLTVFLFLNICHAAPVSLHDEAPVSIKRINANTALIDFGRVSFSNLRFEPSTKATQNITVHFGEALSAGRVNRQPPGTVRYAKSIATLNGTQAITVAPPADKRNTSHPKAIHTPEEWGVVLPFRWVEVEGWTGELTADQIIRQSAYSSTWDDDAATFECSNAMLNRIWELCRYSIKATTFAGVYVDGDRERIPYEADAYLNQISHYATDNDLQMARDTFDQLMKQPTWPTEWAPHMIFMAYADWMHTGNIEWLAPRYESFKKKLLLERVRPDGLIGSNQKQIKRDDIVDWPPGERDAYVFTPVNTVVNAFHLRALTQMAGLAHALNRPIEAADFRQRARDTHTTFQDTLFDKTTGLFRDGIGTNHSSLHANAFPLAFGIVPSEKRPHITQWLQMRGMACSVYAAQYLLEALFENGSGTTAVELMTANNDRSWRHMVQHGATITWEAWDHKYKPNQDWNHAWGAAPANLFPRYVLGAEAATPGWGTARIRPYLSGLEYARGKVPTPKGAIEISWEAGEYFKLSVKLPKGMEALIELPQHNSNAQVYVDGKLAKADLMNQRWVLDSPVKGEVQIEIK
jgi:alpha-L-rhamnosidase